MHKLILQFAKYSKTKECSKWLFFCYRMAEHDRFKLHIIEVKKKKNREGINIRNKLSLETLKREMKLFRKRLTRFLFFIFFVCLQKGLLMQSLSFSLSLSLSHSLSLTLSLSFFLSLSLSLSLSLICINKNKSSVKSRSSVENNNNKNVKNNILNNKNMQIKFKFLFITPK